MAAAIALAKRDRAIVLVAKLHRLSRSVAFIAALMDSKGFHLALADMPGANRLTLHVLAAAAEHERHMIRRAHTPCSAQGRARVPAARPSGRSGPRKNRERWTAECVLGRFMIGINLS